jgi:hypothetical protein
MNMEGQWKDMGEHQDKDLVSLLKMSKISKLPSKDPLAIIKRNLVINSMFGVAISGLYIFILVRFPFWQIIVCIGIVLLFTIWAIGNGFQLYKKIQSGNPANSVLQQMEEHYHNIKRWMTIQQWVGLIIYPISGAGGFMLGGYVGSGKPIDVIMQKPGMIISLLIVIVILVPCCFYLAKWMNRKAFGRYAEALKQNIEALKKEM